MKVKFYKYHALGNSFVIIDPAPRLSEARRSELAAEICDQSKGVGADGLLWISSSRRADYKIDVYNADGGWAEKSGNGMRIAAVHLARSCEERQFEFEIGSSVDRVKLGRRIKGGYEVHAELEKPFFEADRVPVKSKEKFVINAPIDIGGVPLPMTCLAVGNPHAVLVVDDFEFDWKALGSDIEQAPAFPNGTNVEFVQPVNRKRLRLCDWERGAGATGSSGTGAAAAVCAMVMLGLAERKCRVEFEAGVLQVDWNEETGLIRLTGPVEYLAEGEFDFR